MQVLITRELKVEQLALELACLQLVVLIHQELLELLGPWSPSNCVLQIFDTLDHVLEPVVIIL